MLAHRLLAERALGAEIGDADRLLQPAAGRDDLAEDRGHPLAREHGGLSGDSIQHLAFALRAVGGGAAVFFQQGTDGGGELVDLLRGGADEALVLGKDLRELLQPEAEAGVAGEPAEEVGVAAARAQRLGRGERVFLDRLVRGLASGAGLDRGTREVVGTGPNCSALQPATHDCGRCRAGKPGKLGVVIIGSPRTRVFPVSRPGTISAILARLWQ